MSASEILLSLRVELVSPHHESGSYLVLCAEHHRGLRCGFTHFTQVAPLVSPREFVFVMNLSIAGFAQVRVVVVTEHTGVVRGAQHTCNHRVRLVVCVL